MKNTSTLVSTFISYRKQLNRAVGRIVRWEDVEDIVQETFVKSYEAQLKQKIQYERTYMLKTATNLALNHVSRCSQQHHDSLDASTSTVAQLHTRQLETEVESKERFLDFCRATNALSPEVKRVFILKKVYGLSQKEIAEQLGLSESTVEKHVAKGILQCAQYLR